MKNIELLVSESIKSGKWLDISYENNKGEITYYWIAINDIYLKKKVLNVSIFNDQKSLDTIDANIRFDKILTAKILNFTSYDTPIELINKLETQREDAKWLKYETFNKGEKAFKNFTIFKCLRNLRLSNKEILDDLISIINAKDKKTKASTLIQYYTDKKDINQ